ncbi:Lrp/AsnC family transcriptional regulator [Agromyces bauzanensis]
MNRSVQFDEIDIALLEALQVNVRAPWEAVADAIGVDGVTARRRWARILQRRAAWTTVSTGNLPGQVTAVVTAKCAAGAAHEVARELARNPRVVSVETVIGAHDLRLTVVVRDIADLGDFLSHDVIHLPRLLSLDSQLIDRVYMQGARWRPGALSASAEAGLQLPSHDQRAYSSRTHEIDGPLTELLVEDARLPATVLADRLNVSETLVRRRIKSLTNSGLLVLRAEAAPHLIGLPYGANVWYQFAAEQLATAAGYISSMPEARWTASVLAGAANLFVVWWVDQIDSLHRIERKIQSDFPGVRVIDRSMRLQPVKRMMHMLDDEGLTTGVIPWMPQSGVSGDRKSTAT